VQACESLRSGPHTEVAPSSLRDAIREDLAALQAGTTSIERYISSASVLRRLPRGATRTTEVDLMMSRACPAFVGFAANAPSHCAVSPLRYRVAFANAIASARPPCTPACLIDADASLSQSQPFDFCNEIFKVRHTSTNSASAVLARRRGWPCDRCHARCALNAARLFLF